VKVLADATWRTTMRLSGPRSEAELPYAHLPARASTCQHPSPRLSSEDGRRVSTTLIMPH